MVFLMPIFFCLSMSLVSYLAIGKTFQLRGEVFPKFTHQCQKGILN